ncbi:MAG TPA: hypothetical protein VGF77_15845 [Allosphingosinicella sp.]|jgi:ABC-type dipeptide/oligopeptide/nickel transport system ATPase component
MEPLNSVEWGPIDANRADELFTEKWIEPDHIRTCLDSANWIVTGEKGSGKSAIQRAIREIHESMYFVTPLVSFNDVTFRAISENLVSLADTTKISKTSTLSNYWQYCIIVELIKACSQKDGYIYGNVAQEIPQERRRRAAKLNFNLLSLLEEAWNKIDFFTEPEERGARRSRRANLLGSHGLSAALLHDLSTFPLDARFQGIKHEFYNLLSKHRHNVILILDDFDKLRNDGTKAESVQLIFESLVDAILSIRADSACPEFLSIKAFIPHDRYLRISLRDSDKISDISTSIRWTHDTLRQFVKRRIETTTKISGHSFSHAWQQVMPRVLVNPVHKLEEDTFEYLVRHTMMRPRQLQIHLGALAKRHAGMTISPTMIPKSVAASSAEIAKYFIDEFALDYPNLDKFVLMFSDKNNVMEYSKFREQILHGLRKFDGESGGYLVDSRIDDFYSMGLFGIVRFAEDNNLNSGHYYPPTREGRHHYVEFFYRRPYSSVSGRLQDDALIALHPVFVDYANLKPHSSLIIG